MPIPDILHVQEREGIAGAISRHFNILFAASGDLKNGTKTIVGLPEGYSGECVAVLNDMEFIIVGRNAIMLLIAMRLNPEITVPIIIHLWYSALLPSAMMQVLESSILPLVQEACDEVEDMNEDSEYAKTFEVGGRSVCIVLRQREWVELGQMCKVLKGFSVEVARKVRQDIMLAPERIDHVDKRMYKMSPARRMCAWKFRADGLLLPYGVSRKDFTVPNP
jgi:hypothetical protein